MYSWSVHLDVDFLTNYGLFLAKTVTFVIAIAIIILLGVAASAKAGGGKEKGHIEIKKLNEKFEEFTDTMSAAIKTSDQLKKENKIKKKEAKEKKKKSKQKKDTSSESDTQRKRVFVTKFEGDIKASDTALLREVITAILSIAKENDEVVLCLESQGGMVHSYGLASSQLTRVTNKNIPLTVCVDKVAASGGYMMACVADKILSAPFAIVGSIGVVAQLPNFHKLLKKNDVDFEILTAGEYKRTLTMFGENTEKGRKKFVDDLEDTHTLFKDFVSEHRDVVDIGNVATGEIWFGTRALENKLVDEIKTSDEYLFELKDEADIFQIEYIQKKTLAEKVGVNIEASIDRVIGKWWQNLNSKFFT